MDTRDRWIAVVALDNRGDEEAAKWAFLAHLVDRSTKQVVLLKGEETEAPPDFFNDCCFPQGLPRVFAAEMSAGKGTGWDAEALKGDFIELAQLEGAMSLTGRRFEFHTSARLDNDEAEALRTLEAYFPAWKDRPVDRFALCIGTASLELGERLKPVSAVHCLHPEHLHGA